MSKSKQGWLLYVMFHVPNVLAWKVGITHARIGAKSRARQIDKAVFGWPVPIFFCVVPFAWHIEQAIHGIISPFRWRFYRGDGASEWFFFIGPLFVAIPIMLLIWWAEYEAAKWALNNFWTI